MSIYRILLSLCLAYCLFSTNSLHAQDVNEKIRSTNNATLIGVGSSNLYDTYLSPLKYTGTSFRLMNERMRKTSWFNNNFTKQQLIDLEVTTTKNPIRNADQYSVLLGYTLGGHYNLIKTDKFRFSAGGLWNISGGVLYNQRNSNNPASARAYSNINLSAIAFYSWKNITFRGQIDAPVLGVLFSPHYGQSYYEISLGNSVDVINFASLHNQRALRTYFTADIPVSKVTLRVGYLGSFYQTEIHNLQTHNYSNSIVIGLVSESVNLSGNKIKSNKIIDSSFY